MHSEQPPEFDEGCYSGAGRRLESFVADPAEAKCAKSRFVGNGEQIVAFCKRANGAAFAVGEAAFNALHEAASPGVRRGVANGAESRQSGRRSKGAAL